MIVVLETLFSVGAHVALKDFDLAYFKYLLFVDLHHDIEKRAVSLV